MTPCEELGYKVGDLFAFTCDDGPFPLGGTVKLIVDDGSSIPRFEGVDCKADNGGVSHFAELYKVEKIKETQDMIVKAGGKPYATCESAKQQLSAEGLGDTHEVVEHGGGHALVCKGGEQVTLRPGDYVSTKGMTEEQYHAVAEAFMTAGAEKGEYPNWSWASDQSVLPSFGWIGAGMYHGNGEFAVRQLTISQVLSSTSAKRQDEPEEPEDQQGEPCPSVLDTLRLAQQRVNELSHELSIARGVRDEALESVRAELGEGFEISVVGGVPTGVDGVDGVDMSDPANWREGDVVECVGKAWITFEDFHVGEKYKVSKRVDCGGHFFALDDDSDEMGLSPIDFKFHSRPTK